MKTNDIMYLRLAFGAFMAGAVLGVLAGMLPRVAYADEHRVIVGLATNESEVTQWWHGPGDRSLDLVNNTGATGNLNVYYTSFAWNGTAGMIARVDPYPGTCTGVYVTLLDGFFNTLGHLPYTHIQASVAVGSNWLVYGGTGVATSHHVGTVLLDETAACKNADPPGWTDIHLHQGGAGAAVERNEAGLQTYLIQQGHPDIIYNLDYYNEWVVRAFAPDLDSIPPAQDNCPTVTNQNQANFDADAPPFGNGIGIGNAKGLPGHDATTPNGDGLGDECDDDDDNDGVVDWLDSDPRGDVTYEDDNDGNMGSGCLGGSDPSDDGPSWDANCDGVRDSVTPAYCSSIPVSVDNDGDGLPQRWEVCKWGTSDSNQNSDVLGQGDCREAFDVDGNGMLNSTGDFTAFGNAVFYPLTFGRDGDYDVDGSGTINSTGDFIAAADRIFGSIPCV